jgi:hypothetical protein
MAGDEGGGGPSGSRLLLRRALQAPGGPAT